MPENTSPELVIASGRASARFDGSRLMFTHGRTAWEIPVAAVRAVETGGPGPRAGVTVRFRPGVVLPEGTGPVPFLFLPAEHAHAAEAFRARLARAVADAPPVDAAEVRVSVVTGPSALRRLRVGANGRRILSGAVRLGWFAVVLKVTLATDEPVFAAFLTFQALWMAPVGCRIAAGGVPARSRPRRTFARRRLRRRGITVRGRITRYRPVRGDYQYFPLFAFTTAEGRELRDVVSLRTVFSDDERGTAVDVVYDPEDPTLVTRSGPRAYSVLFPLVLGVLVLATAGLMLVGGRAVGG
ncbi:DUF3592 domain-containing protein [Streptomyces sp. NPDC020875]|uniref:DUF3592 domain-containing protein n=1 Tax=Streptomyces sp. NPDC020875 TaxID=3154898 RepID=UPI0033C5F05A